LQGREFPLEDQTTLGRDPSNQISLNEHWVSRQHCQIKKAAGGFTIVDLGSHNGTFLNGVPVKEHELEHGNRIQIADSTFIFLFGEEVSSRASDAVEMDDGRSPHRSTIQLRLEDAIYLQPEKISKAHLPPSTIERDLSALLKVSSAITSLQDMDELQKELLDQIFEIVPAERGAILLGAETGGKFVSEFGRHREGTSDKPVQVIRTLVEQVQRDRAAILSNQPTKDSKLAKSASLLTSLIQSVLCLPLVSGDRFVGVLYLDSRDPEVRFDEDQLELLTAIAGIAASSLENARHLGGLEAENERLQHDAIIEHNMVGEGRAMSEVYKFIGKVAPTDSTVLITGESGTGKELAARAVHRASSRKVKPFWKIDCTTLTENLLESELFGHEKGAFTGAITQKKGRLELADEGTVFLDEMGELPVPLQSKLLRVLQDREFERIGGTRPISVDIRLVVATNRNLAEEMKKGNFREDLFYRLNVVAITLPPLRERREDIPLLANYFTAKYSKKIKRRIAGISPEALAILQSYDFPGNVRELENAIERAIVLGSTDTILPEDLPENLLDAKPAAPAGSIPTYNEALTEMKKKLVLDAVTQSGGNYTDAAKKLGLHPNYLHRLIRNLDIKDELKSS
jgi:Nif-specific regulatory protein